LGVDKLVKIRPLPIKFTEEVDYMAIQPGDLGTALESAHPDHTGVPCPVPKYVVLSAYDPKTAIQKEVGPMRCLVIVLSAVVVLVSSTLPHSAWAQAQPAGPAPPGYVLVEENVVITFANEARKSFRAAVADFLNRRMRAAAEEIRKGAACMKLEAARASGDSRKALMDSAQELEKLANDVQKAAVADLKELQNAFARAEYALARHHYLKAVELRAKGDAQKTGRELQSAADYVDSGQVWLNQKMHEGVADAVNDTRLVAAKMVYGAGATADEVGKAFDGLGKELDKFSSSVAALKK
jgi:hypothetical protein